MANETEDLWSESVPPFRNIMTAFSQNDHIWWDDPSYHNERHRAITSSAFAISSIWVQHLPWGTHATVPRVLAHQSESLFQDSCSDLRRNLSVRLQNRDKNAGSCNSLSEHNDEKPGVKAQRKLFDAHFLGNFINRRAHKTV